MKRALARDARERAERARRGALRARFDALTPRDREVLAHVLAGRLNKQIADDLRIDERSVKRHPLEHHEQAAGSVGGGVDAFGP